MILLAWLQVPGFIPQRIRGDNEFSASYMPERWKLAGQRIAGPYIGIMDGFSIGPGIHEEDFLSQELLGSTPRLVSF